VKQVLIRNGGIVVEDTPAPCVERGTVLVAVHRSCISIGTELSAILTSSLPLWKRALQQPEKVKRLFETMATQGLAATRALVETKLSAHQPMGYSAAGVVIEVGAGIDDLRLGERVACAGAQCAHHAEVIRVPRNLTVPVPTELGWDAASTVTLGAIALQGVRRAQPTIGETFVVIGLGVLGQLTSQILRANGCRVIGTDLDPQRIRLALDLGMEVGLPVDAGAEIEQVARLTDGIGADGVIITAATPSDEVISTAFNVCRKKGRVVLVGDVGLHLKRADFYAKGLDYPAAYVRWTENRNMAEYLRLVAEDKVRVTPLIAATYPVDRAPAAYEALQHVDGRPLMVLLSYPGARENGLPERMVRNPRTNPAARGRVRLALVGAGSFAKAVHLPLLRVLDAEYHLQAVLSRTGHNAAAVARKFGAAYATTDYEQVLNDPEVDGVLIATRHDLHADMTLKALTRGKHVLVEKPLALERRELEAIQNFYEARPPKEGAPVLLTGFNRRFSPFSRRLKELIEKRSGPMILNYRMNAGYMPPDDWVQTAEGGGRNRGEACHIYDLFTYLTESRVLAVEAQSVVPTTRYYGRTDNFVATLRFADGSVATLTYTALGSKDHPKEEFEVYFDGKVLAVEDYRVLRVVGLRSGGMTARIADKGHRDELIAFAKAVRDGGEWPSPLWQQCQATEIALDVESRLSH
jgi:predicted dehydrogenase/threonine dehydrogenase-like Zn-dependent dehydrogenase